MLGINFESPLCVSIFIYVGILALLYVTKPKLCFDSNSKLKIFGCTAENNTLFPMPVISSIISIIVYVGLTVWKIA